MNKGKYDTSKGPGPLKPLSLINTLINCGISSKESFLTIFPNQNNRSLLGNKLPEISLVFKIVRKLIILKFFSFCPGPLGIKNGLPLRLINSPADVYKKIGEIIIKPKIEKIRSIVLLKKILYIYLLIDLI